MNNDIEQKYKDFLSTVSHELRTPLTSIRGFADTLLISYERLSDEQKIKFIQIIKDQSNRLIELVENILSASALKENELSTQVMQSVNPIKPLHAAIILLKNRYKDYNFQIQNNAQNYTIYADENKLQQVFINLLENACKYSPENKDVDIYLDIIKEKYVIKIRDYGIGIKESDFDKIFDKFSRIDNPMTRKTEGSGIGLFLTRKITEQMFGTINPMNVENGACFELVFPLYDAQIHSQKKLQGDKNCLKN